MEENRRDDTPPPDSDPEYRTELTRTGSNSSSSSITLDTSKDFKLHYSHATPGASTEWTNEKHNLYIDSLETSFVNKLYRSMHLRNRHPQNNARGMHSSQALPFKTQNSSDQFMVLRDGCLQKINFQKNETLLESTADSHVTMESPWICHFTSAGKRCNVASPNVREEIMSCNKGIRLSGKPTLKNSHASARSSEQNPLCHQDSVGSSTEVSGQNFVDEGCEGKPSYESIPKRFKRAAVDASGNDQLVPLGNFLYTNEVSVVHNALSEREEQGNNELLLEHPESFICPKNDLHFFLGGS